MLNPTNITHESQVEGSPAAVGVLYLRRQGYNLTCTIQHDGKPGIVYSKDDHHIAMTWEVADSIRIKVVAASTGGQSEIHRCGRASHVGNCK